jgi:hypothetical protein
VKTEKAVPDCVITSSRSKITWSLLVCSTTPASASAPRSCASRARALGSSSWLANTACTCSARASAVISATRMALAHDQPGTLDAMRRRQRAQFGIDADQAVADELDPAVGRLPGGEQRIQDVAVEDEHAPDLACGTQRVVQRRMVVDPQVAAQPDEGAVEGLVHGRSVPRT